MIALRDNIVYFYLPSDPILLKTPSTQRIRLGGLVEVNSIKTIEEQIIFKITDHDIAIQVFYQGLLPDLFAEGKGVIAEGFLLTPDHFQADLILAKHDENYMPPDVAKAMKMKSLKKEISFNDNH